MRAGGGPGRSWQAVTGTRRSRMARLGACLVLLACLPIAGGALRAGEGSGSAAAPPLRSEEEVYRACRDLLDEVRFSRRILLPAPGADADFLLLENGRGELVGYVRSAGGAYERVVMSPEGRIVARNTWLTGVKAARFTPAGEVWPGRGAELVELNLEVECSPAGTVNLETAVRVSNVSEEWMF